MGAPKYIKMAHFWLLKLAASCPSPHTKRVWRLHAVIYDYMENLRCKEEYRCLGMRSQKEPGEHHRLVSPGGLEQRACLINV